MGITNFLIIFLGVLLSASGQIFLKLGADTIGPIALKRNIIELLDSSFNIYILLGLLSYFFSTIIWIVALSRVNVSTAYPMLSFGYVIVAIAAWVLFNEPLSALKITALSIIIFGIVLLSQS